MAANTKAKSQSKIHETQLSKLEANSSIANTKAPKKQVKTAKGKSKQSPRYTASPYKQAQHVRGAKAVNS